MKSVFTRLLQKFVTGLKILNEISTLIICFALQTFHDEMVFIKQLSKLLKHSTKE